jgi:hypothetical protein
VLIEDTSDAKKLLLADPHRHHAVCHHDGFCAYLSSRSEPFVMMLEISDVFTFVFVVLSFFSSSAFGKPLGNSYSPSTRRLPLIVE